MSKEAMTLALEALAVKFSEGWHEGIKIDASDIMLLNDAAQALAEQPAQRTWVPVTKQLLDEQHPWLYQPMWIAMKDGTVVQGYYEWRQGRNPDRFRFGMRDEWAFDAAYVMPIVKPTPPAIEAAHGIKEKNT